ncbi:hypothetical protein Q9233_017582, partial [Columba guinea]
MGGKGLNGGVCSPSPLTPRDPVTPPQELEAIKARVREMEEEAEKLKELQNEVDYGATAEELEAHFHGCGSVNRVTILCDKYSGHPKGFAYIEFSDKESVRTSMALDESLFRGRQIK